MKTINIDQYVDEYLARMQSNGETCMYPLHAVIAVVKELTREGDALLLATQSDECHLFGRVEEIKEQWELERRNQLRELKRKRK